MRGNRILILLGELLAIFLVIFGALLLCCPPEHRPVFKDLLSDYKVHYGLDLKGGSELLYQISEKDVDNTRNLSDILDETIGVISQRIFESNIVKDPKVQKQGEELILIQLPGLNQVETDKIKEEIERLGNLEFRLVASKGVGEEIEEETERPKYERALAGGEARLKYYQERLLEKGYYWYAPKDKATKSGSQAHLLWIKDGYDFTGKKFRNFYLTYHDTRRAIGFELKEEYKVYFGDFTEKYKGERLAIVFNNKVVSAPNINGRIDGVGVMIGFDLEELENLMKILRSGSLEVQPELMNENSIGPSLGEDAIRLGISAGLLGVLCVVFFMAIYYMGLGIIANIAMLTNVILLSAILVIWGETLTLPGVAGILLTMGMSVDANILIFERIREEKKKRLDSYKLQNAKEKTSFTKEDILDIQANGYDRAFSTIFDSNITTLFTAMVLYFVGSGPVKGFGFTLSWGIITNFFTAIFFSRILSTLAIEIGLLRRLTMLEWVKTDQGYKFTKLMHTACVLSVILITLGLSLFFSRGENNYGLDLRGGILAQINLEKPLTTQAVRERLKEKFQVEIQHIVSPKGSMQDGWYDFLIQMPNLNLDKIEEINKKIVTLSKDLNTKNSALKEFGSIIIRAEQDLKNTKKSLNRLIRDKAPEEEIKDTREVIKKTEETIQNNRTHVSNIGKEVDKIKEERQKLLHEKNVLGGIEELRKEIQKQFEKELSPLPFGTMKMGEGRFSSYHVIPIAMTTPVSSEFVKNVLSTRQELFKEVQVGSNQLGASLKIKKDSNVSENALAELIKKQLDIVSRLEAEKIEVKKVSDTEYSLVISFSYLVPEFAVSRALDKCELEEHKLYSLENGQKEMKHIHLFLLLPQEKMLLTMEEREKIVDEELRTSFTDKEYNGEKVYFSNPFPRFTQVSGLVARAQKAKAYQAIFISLIMILVYIGLRFPKGFMYGFGAVMALAHDVLFTISAIAFCSAMGIVNVQIDLTIIAALLTIVGYSINNTIVIFDRLREAQHKYDKEVWERLDQKRITQEFDTSLNQTLGRTLFTSFTTLIVLVCIFVLNYGTGSVMEGFSFALLFGLGIGTYSSWFIAPSIVLMYEKKNRHA